MHKGLGGLEFKVRGFSFKVGVYCRKSREVP